MKKLLFILVLMTGWAISAIAADNVAQTAAPDTTASVSATADDNRLEEALDKAAEETDEHKFDIKETIFEHLGDGYGWEVPFNHHKRIPLPMIVWGKDGLHVFSSSRVTHGDEYVDGDATFKIATEGDYKGKLVEIVDGKEYKPWDFSITKNVCAIFIACIIVLLLVLQLARWHKKNPFKAPRKMTGAIEALVEFIYDGVIKPTLKEKSAKFAPYLLTVFFFIFFMNLLGLMVVFPGGANVTGNIAVTMVLAIMTFVMTNVFGTKVYWKEIFWPDVPLWLKFPLPIMQMIEVFGIFTKPAALTVRLFANMMGGHMIVLILTLLIFIFASMGVAVASGTAVISIAFSVFMLLIDVLVSFIQAYVFTMLSTIFISLAQAKHEEHAAHGGKEGENVAHTAPEAAK
ncbi:MAG: F0F1 ATP synthase subunit A [Muribaculaceae bacterium]|nr:F0F1 ATP synthase subunit A [Muribaculaceae bacterium]